MEGVYINMDVVVSNFSDFHQLGSMLQFVDRIGITISRHAKEKSRAETLPCQLKLILRHFKKDAKVFPLCRIYVYS